MRDLDYSDVLRDAERMRDWTAEVDYDGPDFGPEISDEEQAYYDEQDARGELAGSPDTMDCYECMGFDGVHFVTRKVVKLGPTVNSADPTQSYLLECDHYTI
jgi:hypothetical protein